MTIENHPHKINDKNHLMMGGRDSVEIAKEYGTPLYVYDIELVRKNARLYVDAFKKAGVKAQVTYASKAFSSIAILEVIKRSEEHTSELQSRGHLVCRLLLE